MRQPRPGWTDRGCDRVLHDLQHDRRLPLREEGREVDVREIVTSALQIESRDELPGAAEAA
jgi:uncharacterized protein YukJ